jgi:hypothetical protein
MSQRFIGMRNSEDRQMTITTLKNLKVTHQSDPAVRTKLILLLNKLTSIGTE